MKTGIKLLALAAFLAASGAMAQDRQQAVPAGGREPPPQAYADCKGRKAGDTVEHTTREGKVAATCVDSPKGLVARPSRRPGEQPQNQPSQNQRYQTQPSQDQAPQAGPPQGGPASAPVPGPQSQGDAKRYSIEQATSDRAQLNTIAFDGLAFLTGDFGSDTFLPPGKVSDYFGFQYMRDIDAEERGHNTSFLTRIALNMLAALNDKQRAQLVALAKEQESDIRLFAERRLPLIKAFRQNLGGELPVGSRGLDRKAVMQYSADLYALDGELSYQRARVMGSVLRSLGEQQKASLARLKFGDSRTWPEVAEQFDKRSMSHEVNVAVMTYASEMFSWYAGSLEADTYFCPERHGMYFGGFGMKTAPAMGKQDYSISTTLTGNSGEAFLAALTDTQRRHINELIDLQRQDLAEIVGTRRAIATELRRFLKGDTADRNKVLSLSRRYGELDGEMSHYYALAFAKVGQTLSAQQKDALARMRASNPKDPKGPFLYSKPISMPAIASTDAFFGVRR